MKFGLRYCNTGRFVDPGLALELAQAADEAGFESIWTVEHTVVPGAYESAYPYSPDGKMAGGRDDFPLPDPLIWMAFVASHSRRIRFGTGILIVPQHNPVVAAKQIATLDHMTGGRLLLGIGVGWLKEEFDAIGAPFDDRGRRTDEYVEAMRELWGAEKPTYHGEYVHFEAAYCRPQPVNGSVPIVVGGHSKAAARRAGRLGDGFFPRARRFRRTDRAGARGGNRARPRSGRGRDHHGHRRGPVEPALACRAGCRPRSRARGADARHGAAPRPAGERAGRDGRAP